jgi:hypothetical protein
MSDAAKTLLAVISFRTNTPFAQRGFDISGLAQLLSRAARWPQERRHTHCAAGPAPSALDVDDGEIVVTPACAICLFSVDEEH